MHRNEPLLHGLGAIGEREQGDEAGVVDVDVAEMKAFIAMLILMGLSRRRSYKVHWTTHWLLAVPGMRTVVARDRFFTHFEVFTFDKQC